MGVGNKNIFNKIRKFVYLLLCALLGVVLFLFLVQLLLNLYLLLQSQGLINLELDSNLLIQVYFALTIFALAFGAGYGVWIGAYWYGIVYADGRAKGLVYHVASKVFQKTDSNPSVSSQTSVSKLTSSEVQKNSHWQLDDLLTMQKEPVSKEETKTTVVVKTPVVKSLSPVITNEVQEEKVQPVKKVVKKTTAKKVVSKPKATKKVAKTTVAKKTATAKKKSAPSVKTTKAKQS